MNPLESRPKLLNGFPTGQTPPDPLPGATAQRLQTRSAWLQVFAALSAAPIFFESFVKQLQPWYAIFFLSVVVILVAASLILLSNSRNLAKDELRRGYTTSLTVARRVPGVFVFHPITKQVVAIPGEPRPERFFKSG